MLNKDIVIDLMKSREFVVYTTTVGGNQIQFVSAHMYNVNYEKNTPLRKRMPIYNVLVNLWTGEFKCVYNVNNSINSLQTPWCGPVTNDKHFDNIVSTFEVQAKWLEKLTL